MIKYNPIISKIILRSFILLSFSSLSAQEIVKIPVEGNKNDILSLFNNKDTVNFMQLNTPTDFKKDSFKIEMKTSEKIIFFNLNTIESSDINFIYQGGDVNLFYLEIDGQKHEIKFSSHFFLSNKSESCLDTNYSALRTIYIKNNGVKEEIQNCNGSHSSHSSHYSGLR